MVLSCPKPRPTSVSPPMRGTMPTSRRGPSAGLPDGGSAGGAAAVAGAAARITAVVAMIRSARSEGQSRDDPAKDFFRLRHGNLVLGSSGGEGPARTFLALPGGRRLRR